MSAYQCSNKHIGVLARAVYQYKVGGYHNGQETAVVKEIGQMLTDENQRSLEARYGKDERFTTPPFAYDNEISKFYAKPLELYALTRGYIYQACESADWEDTEAIKLIRSLQQKLISAEIETDKYNEFWSI